MHAKPALIDYCLRPNERHQIAFTHHIAGAIYQSNQNIERTTSDLNRHPIPFKIPFADMEIEWPE